MSNYKLNLTLIMLCVYPLITFFAISFIPDCVMDILIGHCVFPTVNPSPLDARIQLFFHLISWFHAGNNAKVGKQNIVEADGQHVST